VEISQRSFSLKNSLHINTTAGVREGIPVLSIPNQDKKARTGEIAGTFRKTFKSMVSESTYETQKE